MAPLAMSVATILRLYESDTGVLCALYAPSAPPKAAPRSAALCTGSGTHFPSTTDICYLILILFNTCEVIPKIILEFDVKDLRRNDRSRSQFQLTLFVAMSATKVLAAYAGMRSGMTTSPPPV